MKRLIEIFRSPREDGLYLYVDRQESLSRVPEALLARFGKPESAMVLMLEPTRKLARANAGTVLDSIQEAGILFTNAAVARQRNVCRARQ